MRLHEIASFLASEKPEERLAGLAQLEAVQGPSEVPVLIHVLHGAHPDLRQMLLSRLGKLPRPAVAQTLSQLLESDPPHPESAVFFLALAGDPAYNGLLLEVLARSSEKLQVAILHVLSRTADSSVEVALAPLAPHLRGAARDALERMLREQARTSRSARRRAVDARQGDLPHRHTGAFEAVGEPSQDGPSASVANFPILVRPHAGRPGPAAPEKVRTDEGLLAPPRPSEAAIGLPSLESDQAKAAESAVAPSPPSTAPVGSSCETRVERTRRPSLKERVAARHQQHRGSAWARGLSDAARVALGLLLWLGSAAVFGRAAWESAAMSGPARFGVAAVFLGITAVCLTAHRRLSLAGRAALTGTALAVTVALAAYLDGPGKPSVFLLFGHGPGFWGNVLGLATLAVMVAAALVQDGWPRLARLATYSLAGYAAVGFVRALSLGASFEGALVEHGWLERVPWPELQPTLVLINALLPAAVFLCALRWLRGLDRARAACACVFFLVPFLAGTGILGHHLLPTALTPVFGRLLGTGQAGTDYQSAWDLTESGSGRHRVEVLTRGYVPGARHRTYELSARVSPAPVPGKLSELFVTVQDVKLGRDILRLAPGDLDVFEDGVRQTVLSHAAATAGGRTGYRLTYVKDLPPIPSIELTSPATDATVTGPLRLAATTHGGRAARVDLYVDEEPVATFDALPAQATEPIEAFAPGRHRIRAIARDRFGRTSEDSREVTIRHGLPDLAVLNPREGGAVFGESTLEASVQGVRARKVELLVDGTILRSFGGAPQPVRIASALAELTSLPPGAVLPAAEGNRVYGAAFNAKQLGAGFHRFGVRATCEDGRILEKTVTAQVVRTLVAVRFLTPHFRARVAGKVALAADAVSSWPEFSVRRVEFRANGQKIAMLDRAPFETVWDTSAFPAGKVRLDAIALASNGDVGTAAVSVEVTKPDVALDLAGVWDGMTLPSPVELTAVPTGPGRAGVRAVRFKVNGREVASPAGAPFTLRLDPAAYPAGDVQVVAEASTAAGRLVSKTLRVRCSPDRRPSVFACVLRDGAPVEFAHAPAPRVSVDGTQPAGLWIRPASQVPTSFALVVDTSASMASSERQARLREGLGRFLDTLGPRDRVALVSFADEVAIVQPFDTAREPVREALAGLRAFGASAVNDGVFRAVEALSEEAGRRVAVVFTDGLDQNLDRTGPASHRLLGQVVDFARTRHVTVHAVGLGRELRQDGAAGEKALARLAEETGGVYRFAAWPQDLPAALAEVGRHVAAEVELTWDVTRPTAERWHPLAVSWADRPDLTARVAPGWFGL